MEEKELKTSLKQRVVIVVIAVLMLGSMIASYAAIVLAGGKKSASGGGEISEEKLAEYEAAYEEKIAEFEEVSKNDFDVFDDYLVKVVAYDEEAANTGGVKVKERMIGSGRTLTEGDSDYLAYYVGWCADGDIFDSSFNDYKEPTAFSKALDASTGMIEGWEEGVIGMKLGGIREITVPGEKAYGDSMDICGGFNKPLRFMVMAVAKEEPISSAAAAVDEAYMRLQYASYGIDYDEL